jgi:hypothetical protein
MNSDNPTQPAALEDVTALDLLRALQDHPSCPICHLTLHMVTKYLDGFAYESVTDPHARHKLRASLGFCAPHGQAWLAQSDALATAMIYDDVFTQVSKVLRSYLSSSSPQAEAHTSPSDGLASRLRGMLSGGRSGSLHGKAIAAALMPHQPCPACTYSHEVERRLTKSFARALSHPAFMQAYLQHPVGLCLPHLRSVLPLITDEAALTTLLRSYQANLATTSAQLQEVIRKNDYRYSSEPRGPEFAAPARSVQQAGGLLPTQTNPTP